MGLNSLTGFTGISQWALFLGIGLIIFGTIEKRDRYILFGQLAFITLGLFALWILFTGKINVPLTHANELPKEIKALAFFRGAAIFMGFNLLSLLQQFLKFPFQKTGIFILTFFALLLFFMLFSIMQMPNVPPSIQPC